VECVCFGFACVFSFRMFLSFPFVCMCACVRTTVRRYLSPILLGDGMYMTETFRWLILTHTEDLYTRTLDSKFQFKVVLRSMASPPYSQRCRIVRCLFLFCVFLILCLTSSSSFADPTLVFSFGSVCVRVSCLLRLGVQISVI